MTLKKAKNQRQQIYVVFCPKPTFLWRKQPLSHLTWFHESYQSQFNRLPDWSSGQARQAWPMIVSHTPCRSNKILSMWKNTCTWEKGAFSPSWVRPIQFWSFPWSSSARWKYLLKMRPKKWRKERHLITLSACLFSRLSKHRKQRNLFLICLLWVEFVTCKQKSLERATQFPLLDYITYTVISPKCLPPD